MNRGIAFALTAIGSLLMAASAPKVAVRVHEYPNVHIGDTVQIAYSVATADSACYKALGGSRFVIKQCTNGGVRVYMRGYVKSKAIAADSIVFVPIIPLRLTATSTRCDSAYVLGWIRADTTVDSVGLAQYGCP